MPMIRNPILPGFNPDPSICRVGSDYYIATSTFEWYPGVQIHHSRDLANWKLATRPLTRATQLDMRGEQDSAGVWAPCLSHADGQFWLIYTDMKRAEGHFKDAHNFLVTAPAIEGPWSDPVTLNASGFDPSLFHNQDGRKWLVNQLWNYRRNPSGFAGIVLQEYSPAERRLVGEARNIYRGTPAGLTEGPHLYRRGGWYYLVVAEGGTGYNHAVTVARSQRLEGPYETHPDRHILTSRHAPEAALQKAGHASFVDTPAGESFMVHLCGRPLPGVRLCPLGRETALQRLEWGDDGWPRLAGGGQVPALEVEAPRGVAVGNPAPEPAHFDFDAPELPAPFQWLRTPYPERLFSLTERPGHLRLFGRDSIGSWFEQAVVARRQTAFAVRAETTVEVQPKSFQQLAGLVAYYNRSKFHYLAVTGGDAGGRALAIVSCNGAWPDSTLTFALPAPLPVPGHGPLRLGLDIDGVVLQFRWAYGGSPWQPIGPTLDASVLSDEGGRAVTGNFAGNFTGNFIGMAAHDLSGTGLVADFDDFLYQAV